MRSLSLFICRGVKFHTRKEKNSTHFDFNILLIFHRISLLLCFFFLAVILSLYFYSNVSQYIKILDIIQKWERSEEEKTKEKI